MLVLLWLTVAAPAAAQVVRTSLKPETAVLGQPVRVFVDVLFPGEMPRPPRVALPDMPGAQILRYETQATTMNERIDGKDHVGQRFEFALYPRRGGKLEIPAAQVTVLDAKGEQTGRVAGQPLTIEVSVPAGVDPSRPVVAATKFALEQQWNPQPTAGFKAGDALVRTITREAADVPAMAMLELAFTAPPGVRVYVDPPQADDRIERGDLTGRRTDRATYVFERGGSFPIEAVVQPWWDLEAGRLRRAEGSGATVSVTAAPASPPAGDRAERWVFFAATSAGLLALLAWLWPRLRTWRAEHRARWQASEAKAFRDLQSACRQGDARAIYRALVIWRSRTADPAAVGPFAEAIEAVLFAAAPWSQEKAHDLAAQLESIRRRRHRATPHLALPPLNPARAGSEPV